MLIELTNWCVNVTQCFIYVFLWNHFLTPRTKYTFPLGVLLIVGSNIVIMIGYYIHAIPYLIQGILKIICSMSSVMILYKDKPLKKLIVYWVTQLLSMICSIPIEFLCSFLYRGSFDHAQFVKNEALCGTILVNDMLLIVSLMICLRYKGRKKAFSAHSTQMLFMLALVLIHFILATFQFSDRSAITNDLTCFAHSVFQVMLFILVYVQYATTLHRWQLTQQVHELRQLRLQQDYTYSYYQMAEQRFTEISRLRHDIRNLMQTVSVLSENHAQQQTAARLVQDIGKRLNQTKAVQFCEHSLLNTILTLKLQEHSDLVADIVLRDISDLPMNEQALCSYFVMLMDSVAEVVSQNAEHGTAFGLRSGKNAHFFVVKIIFPENIALQNVRQAVMQNSMIRAIVEEHHGMDDITASEDSVTVTMAFPMTSQAKNSS